MLSNQQLLSAAPRRRSLRSLRRRYELYIMDRIEHYKQSMSRSELLALAGEAVAELGDPDEDQFLLTEVLASTAVDEWIKRRLGVRSFEAWRKQYPKLRAAQCDPTHWGLEPGHLVAGLAPRIEPDDPVLVVGGGVESCAYLMAAHDAQVTYLDREVSTIERAEMRIVTESLSSTFDAKLVQFGHWLPDLAAEFVLVIVDAGTLTQLSPVERRELIEHLQKLTVAGGLHALVPDTQGSGPEGFAGHYASWQRESLPPAGRRVRAAPPRGALFGRPADEPERALSVDRRDISA